MSGSTHLNTCWTRLRIETQPLMVASDPSALTVSVKSAPAAAVPGTSFKGGGLSDIPTTCDLVLICSP